MKDPNRLAGKSAKIIPPDMDVSPSAVTQSGWPAFNQPIVPGFLHSSPNNWASIIRRNAPSIAKMDM